MLTYPLIGNYGVPKFVKDGLDLPKYFESDKIHATGLIVGEYCDEYSHWNATKSLSEWLKESNVPAIHGIDTRMLTKILREKGSMLAKIFINARTMPVFRAQTFSNPNNMNLVEMVSTKVYILNLFFYFEFKIWKLFFWLGFITCKKIFS